MRFLFFLLILAACGYGGYLALEQKKDLEEATIRISQLEKELAKYKPNSGPGGYGTSQGQAASGSAAYNPSSQQMVDRRIACPACRSSGKVTIGTRTSACRLCTGSGGSTLKAPPGASICNTCQGMRRLSTIQGNRQMTDPCSQCGSRGYTNR